METMTNEISSSEVYTKLGDRLKLLPAQIINAWLDGKSNEHAKPFILKALYALVYVLAFASVVNISTRAATHHAGWMSYIFGAGFALVVPATVFIAAHFPGLTNGARFYAWVVAVIAAMMSMFIQIKVYMTGADLSLSMLLSGNVDLEALAFSAGIPFFEVLMASLAAIVSGAHDNHLASVELARNQKAASIKAEAEAEAERQRQAELQRQREEDERAERAHVREMERRRMDAEMRQQEALAQQAIRLQEAAQMAEIEANKQAKLIDAESKAQARLAKAQPASESATSQKRETAKPQPKQMDTYDIQKQMITIYQSEPTIADARMADQIGKSKKTIQDLLADLAAKEVVEIKKIGRGKSVTVNGKLPAFLAGELN
jgi:hypothetical protein